VAALEQLKILLNRFEFSRHEASRSLIKARIVPGPATELDATAVTVSLVRSAGNVTIAEEAISFSGDVSKGVVVSFDLSAFADENGYSPVRRGEYSVQAQTEDGSVSVTAPLLVSLITAEEMRKTFCFGAPMYSSEQLMVKKQPALVTGVEVLGASSGTRTGAKVLDYKAATETSPATLQWGGGAIVEISETEATETLPDSRGEYIDVAIDYYELPDEDAAEGLYIDRDLLSDDAIRAEIARATAEVENELLMVFVEPTRIATEPFFSSPEEGEYFDAKVTPAPYYAGAFNQQAKAWHVSLPLQQLLGIDTLTGYIGNTRALEVVSGHYSVNSIMGTVDVIPHDNQFSAVWLFHMEFKLFGLREYIADFWRYKGMAGLKETPPEVIKAIGCMAAIPLLTIAGQAYRAGFASESISKDGVSKSMSYTSSATYGIYSATIGQHEAWLKENKRALKRRYRGFTMTVL